MYQFFLRSCFSFLLVSFSVLPSFSVDLGAIENEYMLAPSDLSVFVDASNGMSIDDIRKLPEGAFDIPTTSPVSIAQMGSTYWLRFEITGSGSTHWVLENLDLHMDRFTLYGPVAGGKYQNLGLAGFKEPFETRDFRHKNFVYPIEVPEGETYTYYIAASSVENHNPFYLKIRSFARFSAYANGEYYVLGIFYGIMLIMGLYNLIIFFSLGNRIYLTYVGYVVVAILISFVEDGSGFQYLWPASPGFNTFLWKFRALLFLAILTLYSLNFLDLYHQDKRWWRISVIASVGYGIIHVVVLLFVSNPNAALGIRTSVYLIPLGVIMVAAVRRYLKGQRHVRYFVFGFAFVLLGQIFQVLRESGIVYLNDLFTIYSFYIGLIFETVVFSYALSDRIKLLKEEKQVAQEEVIKQLKEKEELTQRVNRELEQKVQERTQQLNEKVKELDEANNRLMEQAEEINQMNSQLDYQNWQLQRDISNLSKARVFDSYVSQDDFSKIFPDEKSCLKFLSDLKWEHGFSCRKCGYEKYYTNPSMNYARRCTKCGYSESPSSFTLFHRVRFDMTHAFYILYSVFERGESFKSVEMAETLDMRLNTVWKFATKAQDRIAQKGKDKGDWTTVILE